jgi:hypothetical protein
MINIRTVVQVHLLRERVDVLIAVLAPFVLMVESGYANGWMFAGGNLGLDFNSIMSLTRGFFLEALIYACFKLVRVFVLAPGWRLRLVSIIPLSVGLVGMVVSAGCNLGWMSQSPEMIKAFAVVAQYLPVWMGSVFRTGLGLLFPVGVGVFALFDISHLVEELMKSAHLDNKAVMVLRSESHRTSYLKSLKKSVKAVSAHYDAICDADAQGMINKVKGGDLSFGAQELAGPAQSSATRMNGPVAFPPLPAPNASYSFPQQSPINGQFTSNFPASGMTQPLNIPAPAPAQKPGLFNWLTGN